MNNYGRKPFPYVNFRVSSRRSKLLNFLRSGFDAKIQHCLALTFFFSMFIGFSDFQLNFFFPTFGLTGKNFLKF
jgi:hypothetical protein